MPPVKYDERKFRSVSNSPDGEVNTETIFNYPQTENVVWATKASMERR